MTFFPTVLFVATVAMAAPPRVAPAELMPFLKVVSASAGAPGRIACRDMDLSMAMKKLGMSPDAKAPVAWAANPVCEWAATTARTGPAGRSCIRSSASRWAR